MQTSFARGYCPALLCLHACSTIRFACSLILFFCFHAILFSGRVATNPTSVIPSHLCLRATHTGDNAVQFSARNIFPAYPHATCTCAKSLSTRLLVWRLATDCLFKNSGAATKSCVVSTTNSNSIRSIKTAHEGGRAPRSLVWRGPQFSIHWPQGIASHPVRDGNQCKRSGCP